MRLTSAPVLLLVAVTCLAALLAAASALRRGDWGSGVRRGSTILLAGAVVAALQATLVGSTAPGGELNLVPGASIGKLFEQDNQEAVENVVGNVLMFVPLGFLGFFALRPQVGVVVVLALALSTGIEVTQLLLGDRWVDIDDVLLNATGGFLGAVAAAGACSLTARRLL